MDLIGSPGSLASPLVKETLLAYNCGDAPGDGTYRLGMQLEADETFSIRNFARQHFELALIRTGPGHLYRVFRPSGAIAARDDGAFIRREAHITRVTQDEVEWATGGFTDLHIGESADIGPWDAEPVLEVVAAFAKERAPVIQSQHPSLTVNSIGADFDIAHRHAQRVEEQRLRPQLVRSGNDVRLFWDDPKTKFHLGILSTTVAQADAIWFATSDQADWVVRPDTERTGVYLAHSTHAEVRELDENFIQDTILVIGREGPFGEVTAIYASASKVYEHMIALHGHIPRLAELPMEWATRAIDNATAHLSQTFGLSR